MCRSRNKGSVNLAAHRMRIDGKTSPLGASLLITERRNAAAEPLCGGKVSPVPWREHRFGRSYETWTL